MNPVVFIHLLVGFTTIALALPLIRGRVPMNRWYGIRVRAAFSSPAAWFDINRYGGDLLCAWGCSILVLALLGALIHPSGWVAYDWVSLGSITAGLARIMWKTIAYCRHRYPGRRRGAALLRPVRRLLGLHTLSRSRSGRCSRSAASQSPQATSCSCNRHNSSARRAILSWRRTSSSSGKLTTKPWSITGTDKIMAAMGMASPCPLLSSRQPTHG
jgi:hypothetical protein